MSAMISRPAFKSHIRVHLVPPDFVFFVGESGYNLLRGKIVYLLAQHINGSNTVASMAAKLRPELSELDVDYGILLLQNEGVIREFNDSDRLLEDALNLDPRVVERRLKSRPVRVLKLGDINIEPFVSVLELLGISVSDRAHRFIAVVDDYLRPELGDLCRSARQKRNAWMIVKPTGTFLWIGPVFDPPRTPCWSCLADRIDRNREAGKITKDYSTDGNSGRSLPVIPALKDLAFQLSAIHTLKWLTGVEQQMHHLMTLNIRTLQLEKHAISRIPDCRFCGQRKSASDPFPRMIKLKSCKKIFTQDGGHRAAAAEATFNKYQHHISPITGIVDQVELSFSDNSGLVHSYVAGHLFTPFAGPEALLARGLKQLSAGKGVTPQQAKTGALCEALERYSGVFRGNEFRINATYVELGDNAIHPDRCLNFSENQYRRKLHSTDQIPGRFDECRRIDWSPVWSLTYSRFRYVPSAYCYYGFPSTAAQDFCRADSNGNAAGNTLEEAILHGILEVVERDSAAIWWYNRIRRPAVDLRSFDLPYFSALVNYYQNLGLEVWVLDLTSDFALPCFASIAASKDGRFLLGFGAHLDPSTAAARALTEMNQFLREFMSRGSKHVLNPHGSNTDFLRASKKIRPVRAEDFSRCSSDDLRNDIQHCVNVAQSLELEVFVLNQTRPDIGLPVVKVIIPGMRVLWPRFAKGRLYDVPLKLGWIKTMTQEEQLNPNRIVI